MAELKSSNPNIDRVIFSLDVDRRKALRVINRRRPINKAKILRYISIYTCMQRKISDRCASQPAAENKSESRAEILPSCAVDVAIHSRLCYLEIRTILWVDQALTTTMLRNQVLSKATQFSFCAT